MSPSQDNQSLLLYFRNGPVCETLLGSFLARDKLFCCCGPALPVVCLVSPILHRKWVLVGGGGGMTLRPPLGACSAGSTPWAGGRTKGIAVWILRIFTTTARHQGETEMLGPDRQPFSPNLMK